VNSIIDDMFNDPNEWLSFSDCVTNVTDKPLSKEELRSIFNTLPRQIQAIAFAWGLSDTVFRDEVYTFIVKEREE